MISVLISELSDFLYDTVILLISGCVSLVVLSGVFSVITFLAVKRLKRVGSKDSLGVKAKADESFGHKEAVIQQSKSCDFTDGRAKWFVKSSEKNIKTLKNLKQQPITVASNSSGSSSDKDGEVREFLEHLISTLISENLDDVPLTPLSTDVQYESIFAEYHSKLSSVLSALSSALHPTAKSELPNESAKPSDLYVQLKTIISEISEKASLLPPLVEYDNESEPLSIESRLEGQSYEDILSTAVLNKIVSKCQNGKEPYNFSDDVDLNVTSDFEYRYNSWNSSPRERLSLTVEEHIEEITTRYQSSDDETEPIVECLQRFNLNAGHRAHFPELGKDVVDAEKIDSNIKTNYIYKYDFKNNLDTGSLKGKHFDDSENYGADHDQDSSGVTSISRDISDVYSFSSLSPCQSEEDSLPWTGIREAKNQSIFLGQEDSGEGSLETQPESEYLNDNALEPDISENKVNRNETIEAIHLNVDGSKVLSENDDSSLKEELAQPPKPGTIAEREHLKWEQAAPLPNNPYSKESIEKRNLDNLYVRCQSNNSSSSDQNEQGSDEYEAHDTVLRPDIKKYERDYYVNGIANSKTKEVKEENGIDTKQNGELTQNGFSKILPSHDDKPKKPNLVRVLSWSDRKQPEVEIRKRLPSVKELAKQFSVQPNFHEANKSPTVKNQMVHSLTARSMSKEFRDGLKNNIGKTFNRNVLTNDGNEKTEDTQTENGKLDNAISFWENI